MSLFINLFYFLKNIFNLYMEEYKLDYTQSSLWKRRGYNEKTFYKKSNHKSRFYNNQSRFCKNKSRYNDQSRFYNDQSRFYNDQSRFYKRHVSNNYNKNVSNKIKNYEDLIQHKKNKDMNQTFTF